MKILVVDREDITSQLIASRLEPIGHNVAHEAVKNEASARMQKENYDLVFFDPSPLTNGRTLVLNMRRAVPKYPYIVLLGHEGDVDGAIRAGCNDFLAKPLDPEAIDRKIDNAQRLLKLIKCIKDESEDFPSAGGVISKSAFNQLFLSAIDRADRYGERTFLLLISLNNYKHMISKDGQSAADFAAALLSKQLVNVRRQSDIIGQIGKGEFALLLQRPQADHEPLEAAARFGEALGKCEEFARAGKTPFEIKVSLVDLPVGRLMAEHILHGRSG